MLKLYFGNLVNTVTTLLLVVLLGFLGVSLCHRAAITSWGRPLYPLPIHAGGLVLRPICRGAAEGGHGGGVSIFGVTSLQVNDRLL